jgi:hypothetical protein
MRKTSVILIAIPLALLSFGLASPATSSTCYIDDPDVEDVVCGVVTTVGPFLAPLCESKYRICLQ